MSSTERPLLGTTTLVRACRDPRDKCSNSFLAVTKYRSLHTNTELGRTPNESADYPANMADGEVKSHDYTFDMRPSIKALRVPEVWVDAVDDLILHDHYVRVYPPLAERYRLSGKKLYHLLDCGWVTPQEASYNWRTEDWEAAISYEWRNDGPYPVCIPRWLKKPNAEARNQLRGMMFNPMEENIPESHIFVSRDEVP